MPAASIETVSHLACDKDVEGGNGSGDHEEALRDG